MQKTAQKRKVSNKEKDYQTIILEEMRGDIKFLAECISGTNEKVDGLATEVKGLSHKVGSLEVKVDGLSADFYEFRKETRDNFEFIAKKLLEMENDIDEIKAKLDQKADKNWVLERIEMIQRELDELRAEVALTKNE